MSNLIFLSFLQKTQITKEKSLYELALKIFHQIIKFKNENYLEYILWDLIGEQQNSLYDK